MHSAMALNTLAFGLAASLGSSILAEAVTTCKAFKLVAELTEPSTVKTSQDMFGQSVDGWLMKGVHVGAGRDAAVLNDTSATTFFAKPGTGIFAVGVNYFSTALMLTPVANIPAPPGESVYIAGINGVAGRLQPGIGISTEGYLQVGPPAAGAGGKWLVYHEKAPAYGRPDFQVRYVEPLLEDELPEDSVAIKLKAQCAGDLPPLPAIATYNYDGAQDVVCFEDDGVEQ